MLIVSLLHNLPVLLGPEQCETSRRSFCEATKRQVHVWTGSPQEI